MPVSPWPVPETFLSTALLLAESGSRRAGATACVSIVTWPAYPQTTIGIRGALRSSLAALQLRLNRVG